MFYYFKKGKNAIEKQKICSVYEDHAVTNQMCQKWWHLILDISHWAMLQGQADILKLLEIRDINWDQSTLYHTVDSRSTENIQIKCWKSFTPAGLC